MFWIKIFNLVLLVVLIVWFGRKKMNQYFENKKKDLEKELSEAAVELEKIQAEYAEVSGKLERVQTEIQEMKELAKKDLELEQKRIESETEEFIKKSFRDNNSRMEQAINKTREEFKAELVQSAIESARDELIGRKAEQDKEWTIDVLKKSSVEEGMKEYAS